MTRIAVVSSHPIQYNAPAFRQLASIPGVELHVFYEWEGTAGSVDPEFGLTVDWDIPLLDGYAHTFVPNVSRHPGTHHLRGIDNPAMVSSIEAWKPDVILMYGWSFVSHLRLLRAFHRVIPILFRGDSTLLDEQPGPRRLARRTFLRWIYSHVDTALYTGAANREYFLAHGLDGSSLSWAPHAVDNARFGEDEQQRETDALRLREQLGIGTEDTALLFAGKLSSRKGPSILLDAFLLLENSRLPGRTHLVFVGDGELREELEARTRNRADVHFTGFQNQSAMPSWYRVGDALIMPSTHGETWGLAVNEAMACGRPAFVSDAVGCGADLVIPGKTGLSFARNDTAALASLLSQHATNRASLKRLGSASRILIEDWSVTAFAERVAAAAEKLAR